MAEQIVIFGGTFDPIHHGHLIVARAVAEHFDFEKVTFVPVMIPPHKDEAARLPADRQPQGRQAGLAASAEDRLEMVRLAIAGSEIFEVSDIELRRAGPSYTFDTLMSLRGQAGPEAQLHWVIGADMLEDLPNWHRAGEVVEMARIITAARPPHSRDLSAVLEGLRDHFTAEQVARLAEGVLPTPLIDISSTQIRRRLSQGRSVKYLTPDAVIDYIHKWGIYGCANSNLSG